MGRVNDGAHSCQHPPLSLSLSTATRTVAAESRACGCIQRCPKPLLLSQPFARRALFFLHWSFALDWKFEIAFSRIKMISTI